MRKPISKNEDIEYSMENADKEDIEALKRSEEANKRVKKNNK